MKVFKILTISCLVLNTVGKSQPTIVSSPATNITATTATCGGDVTNDGGSTVTERGVVCSLSPNPTTSNTKIKSVSGTGQFSCSLTNLTPGTTYHVKAYAINSSGPGYSTEITFTTNTDLSTEVGAKLDELDKTNSRIDAFIANQKGTTFKVGMSVAVRTGFNSTSEKQARAIATISPNQNLVQIDYNDQMAVVISTTIAAYPFKVKKMRDGSVINELTKNNREKFFSNFGFLANINLVEFADSKSSTIFNKQVDGGLGFAYLMGTKQQFALAITYERISVRQPTNFIFEHEGKQIIGDNGTALTSLDIKDSRFYRDAGMNGISIKFVFHFN